MVALLYSHSMRLFSQVSTWSEKHNTQVRGEGGGEEGMAHVFIYSAEKKLCGTNSSNILVATVSAINKPGNS